jgi:hypothetical protein
MTAIAKQLDAKLKLWRSPTAQKVEQLVVDIIALADRETINGNQHAKSVDSFLADKKVFRGKTPKDLSSNHDFYLYGKQ